MGHKAHLTGEFLTHRTLWLTAQRFLAAGMGEPKGSFYPLLAATVFSYFAFEAFLNAARRQVVLDAAYAAHPERFVRRAPIPLPLPSAVWINKPRPAVARTEEIRQ